MKILILISITFLSFCTLQKKQSHYKLIEDLIKAVEADESIIYLKNNEIVSVKSGTSQEAYDTYNLILKSIKTQLKSCHQKKESYEILSLEESIARKQFNSVIIPDSPDIYLLYCGSSIITKFLIKNEKIISFSTFDKGGVLVFIEL